MSVTGAITAAFTYDGQSNRVQSTVNGVTTTYIGNYYEWTSSGSASYYYAGSQRIATRHSGYSQDNGAFWLLGDHLGSTGVAVDGAGIFRAVGFEAPNPTRQSHVKVEIATLTSFARNDSSK